MEPETITHGATLLIGVIVGVGGTLFAVFGRSEAAKHELMDRKFWPTLQRVRAATGGRVGVIEDVPPQVARPPWLRDLPEPVDEPGEYEPSPKPWDDDAHPDGDDEDAFPRDEARVTHGSWRREAVRGDARTAAWLANAGGAKHRLRGDDTQDLSVHTARLHHEPEVAAP